MITSPDKLIQILLPEFGTVAFDRLHGDGDLRLDRGNALAGVAGHRTVGPDAIAGENLNPDPVHFRGVAE